MFERIEALLHAEPFVPFRLIMSSGNHYDVTSPYMLALGESTIAYFFPKSDRLANLRKTELTTVEPLDVPNERA